MYSVERNGKSILEAAACGIGFLATRKGVADRSVVELGLRMTKDFDHRGAPGHGAGVQIDIPWGLLIDRFPRHIRLIAQRDVALGMFFLPYEAGARAHCVERVEHLARLAGADVLQWAEVPIDPRALEPGSPALRTLPIVRQALFKRPENMSESGWFACRYLLRLALNSELGGPMGEEFSLVSLSNRTVVYKGLAELSKIDELYPDLKEEAVASRFLLFHSRYCTNTSTAWMRAQPFWSLAHNGEITTIRGNVAWMEAIGKDLIRLLAEWHPGLEHIASHVKSVISSQGSDTANLDDMAIALMAGGMTLPQAILGLLPESRQGKTEHPGLDAFYRQMGVFLGACDGPAALVACDGSDAVAHLDRNGLRPLWLWADEEIVFAGSEMIEPLMGRKPIVQRCLGPGDAFVLRLRDGSMMFDDECATLVAIDPSEAPASESIGEAEPTPVEEVETLQLAFGMTKEDLEVVLEPLMTQGKPALGSMGDDTPPSALLDVLPRRLEDYFALRFAQETSPPVDPIRDEWVFDEGGWLGDRGGLWSPAGGALFKLDSRILNRANLAWLVSRPETVVIDLTFGLDEDPESAHSRIVEEAEYAAAGKSVVVLSDRNVGPNRIAASALRVTSRLHARLAQRGVRHRVGIVVEAGIWDIQPCALLVSMGADAVQPWLGSLTAAEDEKTYIKGIRSGFLEVMSMVGVTPSSAYCGAALIESIGLDPEFVEREFPNVPAHLGGIGPAVLNEEWAELHAKAYARVAVGAGGSPIQVLPDAGEYRQSKEGRPHYNDANIVRAIQLTSGYAKKIHGATPGSYEAYRAYSDLVTDRRPITVLDTLRIKHEEAIPIEEVESVARIAWRFMAPGMSEGALSEPAHRAIAKAFNTLYRLCRKELADNLPFGIGPIANSGEGGFDKARIGKSEGNRSVQYAGGRFTITPQTAASAAEAEVKFAQGAKPGKGGQLPGKKVTPLVAQRRGCEPGFELVSPPINHNLYSIEDVKLMIESWRTLNPDVNCSLKYVATHGIEAVAVGGANAGANRLHISDGCGGTGAAKRVDQKHAGIPVAAVLPRVQDRLIEEGLRDEIELSVDGGVQNGEQFLKLVLLGADRVGFGTSLLMAIGCSMLRKCHLAGPDPKDPTGKRRLGCAPGVATQDPALVGKFSGKSKHIVRFLLYLAQDVRELMADSGIRSLDEVVGRRDLLEKKPGLEGKAALLNVETLLNVPPADCLRRRACIPKHLPRDNEANAATLALDGQDIVLEAHIDHDNRDLGLRAAGVIARAKGDLGLEKGSVTFRHQGAAGHFYAAYSVAGLSFDLTGVVADSCFTAAYGGELVIRPANGVTSATLVGNAFGYGARGGRAFIAGSAGNRFGICFRKNHEGGGPTVVVEGVAANGFQYMTGGRAIVLGPVSRNLGSGMTGGAVYLLDLDERMLNTKYVHALPLDESDAEFVKATVEEHRQKTGSPVATDLLSNFDATRFRKVVTKLKPEVIE
jgi:glutamate synthase domain-containing protein 2/glutamate synthase domain-containing protein 1/glutamate synthase domain-containing protein 3